MSKQGSDGERLRRRLRMTKNERITEDFPLKDRARNTREYLSEKLGFDVRRVVRRFRSRTGA